MAVKNILERARRAPVQSLGLLAGRHSRVAAVSDYARSSSSDTAAGGEIELAIVMPCLKEADTVGACTVTAQSVLCEHGIAGEIVIADNGSRDGSRQIATCLGARVVYARHRGHGMALMVGIAAARGRYVLIGDADGSYDFSAVLRFVEGLRDGHDLVQGCRLERGGGRVLPGAMPILHRRVGNPLFSWMTRRLFQAPVSDVCCGLRGFSMVHYRSLNQSCEGMEFAAEMIVKSSLASARIVEIPITLRPGGRKAHHGHLRTMRDGWRTLCYLVSASRSSGKC